MDAYTFLIYFFRGLAPGNWIELTYIHPDKAIGPYPIIDMVDVSNNVALRDALQHAAELNQQGYGVYFGTCPRKALPAKGKRGSEDHVDTLLGFWAEVDSVKEGRLPDEDLKHLQAGDFVPSFCVMSGGGVHCYWMFDQPYVVTDDKRQLIKSAIQEAGKSVQPTSKGDNVADFARIMRLPGFVNTKPGRDANPVTFVPPSQKRRYSIDDLLKFAPVEKPKPPRKQYHYQTTDAVETARAALKALNASRFTVYSEWIEVGMCLYDLGSTGLALWDEFSSHYPNYESGICEKMWKGFRGEKHIASLYHLANQDHGTSWRPTPPPTLTVSNLLEIVQTENKPETPHWTNGLPISLRSTLATYAHPAIAPVLELWCEGIAKGIIPGNDITTVQCLLKAAKETGRNVTECTIRTGLNQGAVQFLRVLSHNSISIEESSIQDSDTVTVSEGIVKGGSDDCDCPCKNPLNAGREATYYQLLPPRDILLNAAKLAIVPILMEAFPPSSGIAAPIRAEFLDALGLEDAEQKAAELQARYKDILEKQPGYQEALDRARLEYKRLVRSLNNETSVPIPSGRAYPNAAQYMAACARAIIEAEGGETQFSIGQWCDKLGCSERNLKSILTRAGIRVLKQQNADMPLKSIAELKAMPAAYNREARGFPKAVVSSLKPDAPYGFAKKGLYVWAEGELAAGATLGMRFHQANRQTIAPDPVIDQPKKRLVYSQIVALRLIIAYVIDNLVADEKPWQPAINRPERPPMPVVWRWNRVVRTNYMLGWLMCQLRPTAEIWLDVLAETVSAWKVEGSRLVDKASGEIRDHTVDETLGALLAPNVSPPLAPPENIPKVAIYEPSPGADLFSKWHSFDCPDKRDDWYLELCPADKLALIEYRQTLRAEAIA